MATTALYYPFMRIQDERWLKATLLAFNRVQRITPIHRVRGDFDGIEPYIKKALVGPAPLGDDRVEQAQVRLADRIDADAENISFRERFDEAAELLDRSPDDKFGFQMHHRKLHERLRCVLRKHGLAWDPGTREPHDRHADYVQMHPRLGEAIMSTLAVTCAGISGAEVVGDKRSEHIHEHLVRLASEAEIYDALLHETPSPAAQAATAHELFEFVIAVACDTSSLSPETLAKLGEDRTAFRLLMSDLAVRANDIRKMYPGPEREQKFMDETADILRAWRENSKNMHAFWQRFLFRNRADVGKDVVQTLLGAGFSGGTGAAACVLTAPFGPAAQAGAGIAVALVAHGLKSYADMRDDAGNSVHRYLSSMEDAGVVFRSTLKAPSVDAPTAFRLDAVSTRRSPRH